MKNQTVLRVIAFVAAFLTVIANPSWAGDPISSEIAGRLPEKSYDPNAKLESKSAPKEDQSLSPAKTIMKPAPGSDWMSAERQQQIALAQAHYAAMDDVILLADITIQEKKNAGITTWNYAVRNNKTGEYLIYAADVRKEKNLDPREIFRVSYVVDQKTIGREGPEISLPALMYLKMKEQNPKLELTYMDFKINTRLSRFDQGISYNAIRFEKGEHHYVALGSSRFDGTGAIFTLSQIVEVGNVNLEKGVSSMDASLVMQLMANGKPPLKDSLSFLAADVNNNGQIDNEDAKLIQMRAVGLPIAAYVQAGFAPKIGLTPENAIAQITGIPVKNITIVNTGDYYSPFQTFLVRTFDRETGKNFYSYVRLTKVGEYYSVIGKLAEADYESAFKAEVYFKLKPKNSSMTYEYVASRTTINKRANGIYSILYHDGPTDLHFTGKSYLLNGRWVNELSGKGFNFPLIRR